MENNNSYVPWYSSKKVLEANKTEFKTLPFARDSVYNSAQKAYTWCKDQREIIGILGTTDSADRHFNELWFDKTYPSFIFFDLDRNISIAEEVEPFDVIITTFLSVTQRFLKEVYNIEINLVIGTNTHIGFSITPTKYSAHIRINIKCTKIEVAENVAINLSKFVYSNVYCSDRERFLLTFIKQSNQGPQTNCLIDKSVYRNFGCYRTIYSSKWKQGGTPLLPYKSSSKLIKDHLVIWTEVSNPDYEIPVISQEIEFVAKADYSKINESVFHPLPKPTKPLSEMKLEFSPDVNTTQLEKIANAILKNKEVHSLIKCDRLEFDQDCQYYNANNYNFYIKKSCNHCCPYAGRVHSHNRSYFQYNFTYQTVTYRCFSQNDECHMKYDCRFKVDHAIDSLSKLTDLNNTATLHCKNEIIQWDEVYDEPQMREYPIQPLIIVRANMGVGKTKILITDYLPKNASHPNTSVLFITYQRMLARKYYSELEHLGYTNYLDYEFESTIPGNKVIVCLDSLCKVATRDFKYIIIDEATSVFLHFNSQYMANKSTEVCNRLDLLLRAQRILLLDATADNTIVHDVAQYISLHKNVKPYFIKNTYVRPTNRTATIVLNTERTEQNRVKVRVIDKIIGLLRANKNVVVTSSTKSFITEVHTEVKRVFASGKTVAVYHSGITGNNVDDLTSTWSDVNVLMYSPSISAGVSFEQAHFHELVGYIENSFFTPPVDTVLQQLFRVRQLIDGKMSLYVNDTISLNTGVYPTTPDGVDLILDKDLDGVNTYLADNHVHLKSGAYKSHPKGIYTYDKTLLSYILLRGIIINKSKSLTAMTKILRNTLIKDYNIPTNTVKFEAKRDEIRKALELQKRTAVFKSKEYEPFSKDLMISEIQFEELENKKRRGDHLMSKEKHQMWVYTCVCDLWGVHPRVVDEGFYNEYIGPPTSSNQQKMYSKFFKSLRYKEFMNDDIVSHQIKLSEKLTDITDKDDHVLELYKSKVKEHYKLLIEGHYLMDFLGKRKMSGEEFYTAAHKYINGLSDERFSHLMKIVDHNDTYTNKSEITKAPQTVTCFVKSVLGNAFDLIVKSTGQKQSNKTYYYKDIISFHEQVWDKYQPSSFIHHFNAEHFVLSDDGSEEY